MRRRRPHRRRHRHGLRHIGDLLPTLIGELERDLVNAEVSDVTETQPVATATLPLPGDEQSVFAFYDAAETG